MRPVRSPAAPKITMTQGSPCLPMRGGAAAAAAGFSAGSAMNSSSGSARSARERIEPRLRGLLCLVGTLFHVPAEFLAHGGKHLLRERVLLSPAETHV